MDILKDENIKVVCKLHKSSTPITSKIVMDDFTDIATKNFDYDFDGTNKFYPYEMNDIVKNLDFNIMCIVGASGSGKSTFSKYYGGGYEENLVYDNSKAIISNFENKDDAIEKLIAVGLNSIPTWCKPRNVLSIGEGFRCDLARRLKDNCVIDEFTSTIDRNVALSCAKSVGNYIRKKGLKKCVFVSCHKDFIDTLCPDYVIDLDQECVFDTRGCSKRKFELSIYERFDKKDIWNIFRQHHYLSKEMNMASRLFVAYLGETIVGMCAILPMPNGYLKDAYRIHRLVVLPDYQGLGVGMALYYYIINLYAQCGKKIYMRTSHIKLYNHFKKHNDWWEETQRSGQVSPNTGLWTPTENRIAYSFKYIRQDIPHNEYANKLFKDKESFEQLSMFDII